MLAGSVPQAWPQLSIDSQVSQPGGFLMVPILFSGAGVSSIQFDLIYPPTVTFSVLPGEAARSALKTIYTADINSGCQKRFLLAGLNQTTFPTGALLYLAASIDSSAGTDDLRLQFTNITADTEDGTPVAISAQDGTISIQTGQPNVLAAPGVLNAASLYSEPVAPGEILILLGTGLRPASGALDDTMVLVNDIPATVLHAAPNRIKMVIPDDIAGQSSAHITVNYQGRTVAELAMPVALSAPGIFSADGTGLGQAALWNEDGTENSFSQPAARGSTVRFLATGAGKLTSGDPASLPVPLMPVLVTIGGIEAAVSYVGSVPSLAPGMLQVRCQVPLEETPGAAVPIILQIGDQSSQAGLTMAIK
jgi:uncharacterized protein (TIGR03437 family)